MTVGRIFSHSWRPLRMLITALQPDSVLDQKALIREYKLYADTLNTNYGYNTTVKILKDIDSRAKLACLNQKVLRSPFGGIWMKTNSLGLPKELKLLSIAIVTDPKLAIQITSMVRKLRTKPSLDINSITSPSKVGSSKPDWFESFQLYLWNNLEFVPIHRKTHWHTSSKSGPNGPSAVMTAGLDAIAIWFDPNLQIRFREMCKMVGSQSILNSYYDYISSLNEEGILDRLHLTDYKLHQAKLAFLSEKAGKTRVVYVLNYYFQELLFPLHQTMMEWLKQQPQDGTFDQARAVDKVIEWSKDLNMKLTSYDLTAATDRWPKWHQHSVLRRFAGSSWTKVWNDILAIEPYVKHLNGNVCYSVGQPMGAYASWASLAMTHHMLVRFAITRIPGASLDCYVLLGDDIVIANKSVAIEYHNLVTSLGVEISESKSVLPEKQIKGVSAEFAKQCIADGDNLSPISIELLAQIFEQYQWYKFDELIAELYKRRPELKLVLLNSSIYVPSPLEPLWKLLSKFHKELLVLLAFPESPRLQLTPLSSESILEGYVCLGENPWHGIDPTSHTYLVSKLDLMMTRASTDIQRILELRSLLQSSGPLGTKGSDILYYNSFHPLALILERLEMNLLKLLSLYERGDSSDSRELLDLAMDVDYIIQVAIKGTSHRDWKDQKSKRQKYNASFVARLHESVTESYAGPSSYRIDNENEG